MGHQSPNKKESQNTKIGKSTLDHQGSIYFCPFDLILSHFYHSGSSIEVTRARKVKGDGAIYFKLSIPENRTVPFSSLI